MFTYAPKKLAETFQNNFSAKGKASSAILTNDEELKGTNDYDQVVDVVTELVESGITRMGEGYCVSVSDIVFNLLSQRGIKCHLAEVQLSAYDEASGTRHMIGFETTLTQNTLARVNTHVVVITDTEIPMLIDASIAHKLPGYKQVVIDRVSNAGNKVVLETKYETWSYIYQEKLTGIRMPQLHQISIIDRIATDRKIFGNLKSLQRLNLIGIVLSAFAVLNVLAKMFWDSYQ